ncbi:MAG: hypothetical protein A2176_09225 [Spirochaetes bacterium RBG_13_51_14]|nr:MAG: hypothetical protein A2176_09225 [Spirochaetes bacterium RBG_13_51_14]
MRGSSDRRPEIVAPAGNLEKLKFAVIYGADAVYFGGGRHNLRIQSDNLAMDDIAEALRFCRERGVRTIFLLNSFLHEKDIAEAERSIAEIKHFAFDAVMVSDPGMLMLVREAGMESEIHLSTQMSTLNHRAARFWTDAFKIEGRMKSIYYVANTTRIYRHAADHAASGGFDEHLPFYRDEQELVSHRPYTGDLFNEFEGGGVISIPYIKKALFLGYKTGAAPDGAALIKTFNPIRRHETVEAIFPISDGIQDGRFTVCEIIDRDGSAVDMARPNAVYRIMFDREMGDDAVLRRRL